MLWGVLAKWVLMLGSLAAGLLPIAFVGALDVVLGQPYAPDWLWIVAGPPFGPLLVSLAFAARLRWRALWIALGGVFVQLVVAIAFLASLSGANWS